MEHQGMMGYNQVGSQTFRLLNHSLGAIQGHMNAGDRLVHGAGEQSGIVKIHLGIKGRTPIHVCVYIRNG